ncbi:hypothetical protein F0170_16455 [Pseudomonas sp. MAFF 730085]|uniref:Uncharacterized protein n=1 Tax=Pseudomonas kitaguniensis TaxID=2607908 RepID=A0A5N7JVS6_9PSED|nr:hypothetical protein [Pseudomonas kitaguniensis]
MPQPSFGCRMFYGGCAWETFGSAGFWCKSSGLRTRAQLPPNLFRSRASGNSFLLEDLHHDDSTPAPPHPDDPNRNRLPCHADRQRCPAARAARLRQ